MEAMLTILSSCGEVTLSASGGAALDLGTLVTDGDDGGAVAAAVVSADAGGRPDGCDGATCKHPVSQNTTSAQIIAEKNLRIDTAPILRIPIKDSAPAQWASASVSGGVLAPVA